MKKLIPLLLIAAIGMVAAPVKAGLLSTTINGGTNNVAGATTKTYGDTLTPVNSTSMALFVSYSVISGGTSNNVVQLSNSLDNSHWNTNAASVTILSAGTATVTTNVNITVGGIPFWRVESFQNVNVAAITNLIIHGFTKPGL